MNQTSAKLARGAYLIPPLGPSPGSELTEAALASDREGCPTRADSQRHEVGLRSPQAAGVSRIGSDTSSPIQLTHARRLTL